MVLVVTLLAALVALLAVPLELAFELERVEAFEGQVSFRWLFGAVRVRLAVPRVRPSHPGKPARPREARERGRRKARVRPASVVAVLRQAAFRRRVHRLVGDLVRAIRVSRLRLLMRLGLGDPADTGCLWAFVGPLSAAVGDLRGAEVRIEPEFIDAVLELRARGRVRVIPLRILAVGVGFALSPASIRAWRTLRGDHA